MNCVDVPGCKHGKVLHCNLLRKWHSPAGTIHRVLVVDEEDADGEPPSVQLDPGGISLTPDQTAALRATLDQFPTRFQD